MFPNTRMQSIARKTIWKWKREKQSKIIIRSYVKIVVKYCHFDMNIFFFPRYSSSKSRNIERDSLWSSYSWLHTRSSKNQTNSWVYCPNTSWILSGLVPSSLGKLFLMIRKFFSDFFWHYELILFYSGILLNSFCVTWFMWLLFNLISYNLTYLRKTPKVLVLFLHRSQFLKTNGFRKLMLLQGQSQVLWTKYYLYVNLLGFKASSFLGIPLVIYLFVCLLPESKSYV